MATPRPSKMVKMAPGWHQLRTFGTPREDQDGPTEETRGPANGTKMATERQSKIAKMATRLHGVETLRKPSDLQTDYKHLDFACWLHACF